MLWKFGEAFWCSSRFQDLLASIVIMASRSVRKAFLQGLAWVLFAIAGLAFLVGGRAISEFGKIDRILAEMLSLFIAAATGALGYFLKDFWEDYDWAGQKVI